MDEFRLEQNPITCEWVVLVPEKKKRRSAGRSRRAKKKRPLYRRWYRLREGEINPLRLWG
ncbi:MAG: hypothetical protein ACE5JO_07195 [Candidatus Binatia bacterium]